MPEELTRIASQATEKLVTETQKGPLPGSGESQFSNVLAQQMDQHPEVSQRALEMFGIGPDNRNPIKAITAEGLTIDPAQITAASDIRTHNQVVNILSDVNRNALQMDSIMEMATSGRHFSPTELLAMQAGVYSIVQEVELTSKVFEGLNTAQRQLVNTNIA